MRLMNGPRSPIHAVAAAPAATQTMREKGVCIRLRTQEVPRPRPAGPRAPTVPVYWPNDHRDHHPEVERPPDHRGAGADRNARRAGIDAPTPERRETGGSRCAVQMWGLGDETVL